MRVSVFPLLLLCLLAGCHRSSKTWHKEFSSPDGGWIASAHLDEYGEIPGAETAVDLIRPDKTCNEGHPFQVLAIQSGESSSDGAGLSIRWIGPKTIDITYDGESPIDLQVAQYCSVVIHLKSSKTGAIEPAK